MAQIKAGTVTVTNGSCTVTGSGTSWAALATAGTLKVGAGFHLSGDANAVDYTIAAVSTSLQQIQLSAPYAGPTAAGKKYVITTSFTSDGLYLPCPSDVDMPLLLRDKLVRKLSGQLGGGVSISGTPPASGLWAKLDVPATAQYTGAYGYNSYPYSNGGITKSGGWSTAAWTGSRTGNISTATAAGETWTATFTGTDFFLIAVPAVTFDANYHGTPYDAELAVTVDGVSAGVVNLRGAYNSNPGGVAQETVSLYPLALNLTNASHTIVLTTRNAATYRLDSIEVKHGVLPADNTKVITSGDSITQGNGDANDWAAVYATTISRTLVNIGQGSSTLDQGIIHFWDTVKGYSSLPSKVTISFGVNDFGTHGLFEGRFYQRRFSDFIDLVRCLAPATDIILLQPTWLSSSFQNQGSRHLGAIVTQVAKDKIVKRAETYGSYSDATFTTDGTHPTTVGHARIAANVAAADIVAGLRHYTAGGFVTVDSLQPVQEYGHPSSIIGTKQVDESAIGDGKALVYSSVTNRLGYSAAAAASGASGEVQMSDGAGGLSSSSKVKIVSDGLVSDRSTLTTALPAWQMKVIGDTANNTDRQFTILAHGNDASKGGILALYQVGDDGAGGAVLPASGHRLGVNLFGSINPSTGNSLNGGALEGFASADWTTSSIPTHFDISTAPAGSTTRAMRARFDSSGVTLGSGSSLIYPDATAQTTAAFNPFASSTALSNGNHITGVQKSTLFRVTGSGTTAVTLDAGVSGFFAIEMNGTGTCTVTPDTGVGINGATSAITVTSHSTLLFFSGSSNEWITPAFDAVTSVFGRTGAVVKASGDYAQADITGLTVSDSPRFTGMLAYLATLPNSGDRVGYTLGGYMDSATTRNVAGITFWASATASAGTIAPGHIRFETVATAGGTRTERARIEANGDILLGNNGGSAAGTLAANATAGFPYIPAMAGAPSGTPVGHTGLTPVCFDPATNKLWAHNGTAWKSVLLT